MAHPLVMTKQGWLRGIQTNSAVGGNFISFKGIPFAEPPVKELRFRDPQPLEPWTGIKQALTEKSQCIQLNEFSRAIEGEEDCLYLNVATPSLKGSRPVMVWIHGGGFTWGSGASDLYGPDYLLQMDVVFVSFNYRLGVFGFLTLEHEAAPGNMGLKDQVAALKWVKENIAQFGGDPNNVTIFGESAGAVSVHYLLFSPLSEGLFHKAIAQSGVIFNPWARIFKTTEIAHRLVILLDNEIDDPNNQLKGDINDPDVILRYLRSISAEELCSAQNNILDKVEKGLFGYAFAPTVDSQSAHPFFPFPTRQLITGGHDVPLMLGYNSHEGTITRIGFNDEFYSILDQHFEVLLSHGLPDVPPADIPRVTRDIKNFYFDGEQITAEMCEQHIQYMGDYHFLAGVHKAVEARANAKSPTYLYKFSHDAPIKLSTILWNTEVEGAGHFDDIAYLFYPTALREVPFIKPDSTEQVVSERFLRMWTDFARTGNPTPRLDDLITTNWKPVTKTAKNCMLISAELSAAVNPDEEIWQFWRRFLANANHV